MQSQMQRELGRRTGEQLNVLPQVMVSQRSLWGTCFQRCVGQDASNVRILKILQALDLDLVFAALRSSVVLQRRQCGLQPTISTRSDLLKVELRNPSCWTASPIYFTEKRMEHQWISHAGFPTFVSVSFLVLNLARCPVQSFPSVVWIWQAWHQVPCAFRGIYEDGPESQFGAWWCDDRREGCGPQPHVVHQWMSFRHV